MRDNKVLVSIHIPHRPPGDSRLYIVQLLLILLLHDRLDSPCVTTSSLNFWSIKQRLILLRRHITLFFVLLVFLFPIYHIAVRRILFGLVVYSILEIIVSDHMIKRQFFSVYQLSLTALSRGLIQMLLLAVSMILIYLVKILLVQIGGLLTHLQLLQKALVSQRAGLVYHVCLLRVGATLLLLVSHRVLFVWKTFILLVLSGLE